MNICQFKSINSNFLGLKNDATLAKGLVASQII